jgi:Ca2+-binding RTX toxin-like protein
MGHSRFRNAVRLEILEPRALCAYDIDLNNGVLEIEGSDNLDRVIIYADEAANRLTVEIRDRVTEELKKLSSRELSSVLQLEVNLRAGDDFLHNRTGLPMTAFGGDGGDTMMGGSGVDILLGGNGIDFLSGERGSNRLEGGNDGDYLYTGNSNDFLLGGAGDDTYHFTAAGGSVVIDDPNSGESNSLVFLGLDRGVRFDLNLNTTQSLGTNQTLRVSNPAAIKVLSGTSFADTLIGSDRSERIAGGGGNDEIHGKGGNDQLFGEAGNDVLVGGSGNDRLSGDAGNDRYVFGAGQLGADIIVELGTDTDVLDFSGFSQGVVLTLNSQTLVSHANLSLTSTTPGLLENVIGSEYSDQITGNAANNVLWGRGGNDTLNGLGGADLLYGGNGDDRLFSDALDLLFGELGKDTFDGRQESLLLPNPKPSVYRDWGRIG